MLNILIIRTNALLIISLQSMTSKILLYILWFEPRGDSDLVYRMLGVLGIVVASVTVVTPVLHKLSSTEPNVEKLDAEIADLKRRIDELEKKKLELLG